MIAATRDRILGRLKRDAADPKAPNQAKAAEALANVQSGEIKSARQAGMTTARPVFP